jgi:hypothetical protein
MICACMAQWNSLLPPPYGFHELKSGRQVCIIRQQEQSSAEVEHRPTYLNLRLSFSFKRFNSLSFSFYAYECFAAVIMGIVFMKQLGRTDKGVGTVGTVVRDGRVITWELGTEPRSSTKVSKTKPSQCSVHMVFKVVSNSMVGMKQDTLILKIKQIKKPYKLIHLFVF